MQLIEHARTRFHRPYITKHIQKLSYMQLIECESYSYACLPAYIQPLTPSHLASPLFTHPSEPEPSSPKVYKHKHTLDSEAAHTSLIHVKPKDPQVAESSFPESNADCPHMNKANLICSAAKKQ
jgi:hypothetical protein